MTAPLTPANCDLRDYPRMMLDVVRLRGSEFDATLNDSAWRAGVNLWLTSWHQVPAASLPNDEGSLAKAAGLGRDTKTWKRLKDIALRGWQVCDDGLLYHTVIAEIALECWIDKLGNRLSSGAGNAKRYGGEFDPAPLYGEIKEAAALLSALNPKSRSLLKQHVQKAVRGLPLGENTLPPGEPPGPPVRSQGKGREGKNSGSRGLNSPQTPTVSARTDARHEGASDQRSSVEGMSLEEIRARIAEEQAELDNVVPLSDRRQA